jgi:hypothetical protein
MDGRWTEKVLNALGCCDYLRRKQHARPLADVAHADAQIFHGHSDQSPLDMGEEKKIESDDTHKDLGIVVIIITIGVGHFSGGGK